MTCHSVNDKISGYIKIYLLLICLESDASKLFSFGFSNLRKIPWPLYLQLCPSIPPSIRSCFWCFFMFFRMLFEVNLQDAPALCYQALLTSSKVHMKVLLSNMMALTVQHCWLLLSWLLSTFIIIFELNLGLFIPSFMALSHFGLVHYDYQSSLVLSILFALLRASHSPYSPCHSSPLFLHLLCHILPSASISKTFCNKVPLLSLKIWHQ